MMKKKCAALTMAGMLLLHMLPASAVLAQSDALFDGAGKKETHTNAPDISEYQNLPKGLLVIKDDAPEMTDSFILNAEQEKNACDLEDCILYYNQGNYAAALPGLVVAVRQGDSRAEEFLGLMYKSGQGVPKDPSRAFELLLSAAEQGSAMAQHNIGLMLFEGMGVKKNPIVALTWLEIATASASKASEKDIVKKDRDALASQLNRQERQAALETAKRWLSRRNKEHLLKTEE
jgi:hypothetical protein